MDVGMVPLHLEYDMNPEDKIAVTVIGPQVTSMKRILAIFTCFLHGEWRNKHRYVQVQLWPHCLKDFRPCHLFYFYNKDQVELSIKHISLTLLFFSKGCS